MDFDEFERRVRLVRVAAGRYRTPDGLLRVERLTCITRGERERGAPGWQISAAAHCGEGAPARHLAWAQSLADAKLRVADTLWHVLRVLCEALARAGELRVGESRAGESRIGEVRGDEVRRASAKRLFAVPSGMTVDEYERRIA